MVYFINFFNYNFFVIRKISYDINGVGVEKCRTYNELEFNKKLINSNRKTV